MTTADPNRLEIVDIETSAIEWTGTVDEFTEANEMTKEEIEHLTTHGYVVMGGGAAPMVTVRYARKESE